MSVTVPTTEFPGLQFLDSVRQMPLMTLPVRSVVVALSNARVLWSPGSRLTPAQLASAGAVTDIVAPSLLHTAGMKRAAEAHPNARLWGPVGAREKRDRLTWYGVLGRDAWPYDAELALVTMEGTLKIRECAFVHAASRSLLVSDLAFNLDNPHGARSWLFLHAVGTYKRFAVSRLFSAYVSDRVAFAQSALQLLALDFDKIIPSHGVPLYGDVKGALRSSLRERGFAV